MVADAHCADDAVSLPCRICRGEGQHAGPHDFKLVTCRTCRGTGDERQADGRIEGEEGDEFAVYSLDLTDAERREFARQAYDRAAERRAS